MTPARPIPKHWRLLARDAVHWRPAPSPTAAAKHAYHPYGRPCPSPPSTPSTSGRAIKREAQPAEARSPGANSDSSLSSLSPSPEPDARPPSPPHCKPCSYDGLSVQWQEAQHWADQQPSHPLHPLPTPPSALGLSELPSLAHAALAAGPPTSTSLEAEVRLAQLVHASPPEHREYLTPSPTPSRDEWDPTDAFVLWPEDERRPTPRIKHMWTSPMHPPELRFLTLQPGDGYEDGVIYALVSHNISHPVPATCVGGGHRRRSFPPGDAS